MAIKRKKPKDSNQKKKKKRTSFLKNERFKFVLGALVVLLSVYLMIAFISFLFYGGADQSILDLHWKELFRKSREIQVQNWGGKPGAYFAENIINKGFGVSAFVFPYLLFIAGLRFWGIKTLKLGKNLIYCLFILIWLSVTFGLIFGSPEPGHFLYWGGQYGFFLASWIASFIGTIGLVFIILFTGLTLVVVRFENSHLFFRNLFKMKARQKVEKPAQNDLEDLIVNESISKVIEDDDVVKAIFEHDDNKEKDSTDEDFIFETDDNVRPNKQNETDKKDEELKLTVKQKVSEEEADDGGSGEMEDYDPTLDLSDFKFPTLDLLEDHKSGNAEVTNEELISNKNKIVETLRHYKIEITKIRATIGPTITLYEIVPAPGIRIAKIKNLEDDIALSLAALGIRIIAPIPGRGTIGIEVPNQHPEIVSMRSIISSKKFQESTCRASDCPGKNHFE